VNITLMLITSFNTLTTALIYTYAHFLNKDGTRQHTRGHRYTQVY